MDLSVIIPCHNAAPYIGQAVASVLQQTGLPAGFELEVVIADDRSDDGSTPAVLADLARHHTQVRVVANDGARGPGPARNFAVRHARGRWLAFLDADDWWLPGSLARRWDLLAANADAQWVTGDFRLVFEDQAGEVRDVALGERPAYARARPVAGGLCLRNPVAAIVDGEVVVNPSSVVVRRDTFEQVAGFDERFFNAEDVHLWLRLARVTDLYHVPAVLTAYRQRLGSETNGGKPPGLWDARVFQDLRRRVEFRPWRPALAAAIGRSSLMDVRHYRRVGRYRRGIAVGMLGLRYAPTNVQLWRAVAAGRLLRL
ncbi:MAG: glycosyltransferase family 2 protein [Immundisolibacter sp.]|uniref:glycosyltransferase family 2 protein n=1 Tax=Immundisolibacter sp. TaxID=1934948 RepID=UPI003EE1006D